MPKVAEAEVSGKLTETSTEPTEVSHTQTKASQSPSSSSSCHDNENPTITAKKAKPIADVKKIVRRPAPVLPEITMLSRRYPSRHSRLERPNLKTKFIPGK